MPKESAGLLLFRTKTGAEAALEVLLVHLGGPFWAKKDEGAWFVPKGKIEAGEEKLAAAQREFREETGFEPQEPFLPLATVKNKSGKTITAWAFRGDGDPAKLRSNTFRMEWPPRSGKMTEFPEIDRAAFFTLAEARVKIHSAEAVFLERLQQLVSA
jgi:predicted NUDIX family NTP pyrophosphohydrolase